MSAPARLFAAGTRRAIHSSARRLAEPAPTAVNAQGVVSEVPVQKPVGGFRWVPTSRGGAETSSSTPRHLGVRC